MAHLRSRRPRHERVAEIMSAARDVFRSHGYEDAAMAEIASRVGVVEGAIYRFFESKRDLLIQVICSWYQEVMATYERGLAERAGVRERLRFAIWHHLECIHDNPELINLFFGLVRLHPSYLGSDLFQLNKRYAGRIHDVLTEGIESGEIREDAPLRMVTSIIFGAVEQETWAYRIGLREFDSAAVADEITEAILTAYGPKPWRKPSPASIGKRLKNIGGQIAALADELVGEERS